MYYKQIKNKYNLLLLQTLEDANEHVTDDLDDFVVVKLEGHFKVKTNEFGQMSMSIRILGSEYGTNGEDLNQM